MGKNDISLKSYLSEKRRFADLLNCTLMGGSQLIKHTHYIREVLTGYMSVLLFFSAYYLTEN